MTRSGNGHNAVLLSYSIGNGQLGDMNVLELSQLIYGFAVGNDSVNGKGHLQRIAQVVEHDCKSQLQEALQDEIVERQQDCPNCFRVGTGCARALITLWIYSK